MFQICALCVPFQYQRGRRPLTEKWVLGLFDSQYQPARLYLQLVRRRNAATLLPIIQWRVQPGSLIFTDEWSAYRWIQGTLGLNYQMVNHSINFVDPATGVHTQHAESNWCAAKEKFRKKKGNTNPNFLQEYLQEFTWRRWYAELIPMSVLEDYCRTLQNRIPSKSTERFRVL